MSKVRQGLAASLLVLTFGLMGAPAWAAGGGDSMTTQAPADPTYTAAVAAVKARDYPRAIQLLEQVTAKDARNADAYNYLGYSNRELGKFDLAMGFYQKALSIEPDHKGALEYLGELYLKKGDVTNAEAQLARLDDICTFGCEEYRELKRKIAAFKSGQRS